MRMVSAGVTLVISLLVISPGAAGEYLSVGEVASISSASVGTALLGHHLRGWDSTRTPLIRGPLPLESPIQKLLGGSYKPGARKQNFLDDHLGSAITPVVAGVLLLATDLSYPHGDGGKGTAQDLFLFGSGLTATGGLTGVAKGIVSRPRPYRTLAPTDQSGHFGFRVDRSSFFSGHTSSAFFSAAYLNMRLRTVMRTEMTPDDYRRWRWASSSILFSWASFVGLSRIHAHKHYLSDVVIGALAGYLVAELFWSLGKNQRDLDSAADSPDLMLRFHWPL